MPLEAYQRDRFWWVRGYIDLNGLRITDYYRRSTGSSSEAGAQDWIRLETERQVRRHLLGDEASLTFADAVMLYQAKPADARYLIPIVAEIGEKPLVSLTPKYVRGLGPKLYPLASTDTWKRQVCAPVSAVINNAHELGKGPAIRVGSYSTRERIQQDEKRQKQSRVPRRPGSRAWIESVRPHASPYVGAGLDFMFETAARIGQVVAIEPQHLDLQNARVWLIAQKGHPAQWVTISVEMVVTLANLPPRRPHDRRRGTVIGPRVFGYATRGAFASALRTACKAAGVEYLTPHEAGRHGFYTELRVRQGVNPMDAAAAGRWSNPALPDLIYAHSEVDQAAIRARFRTIPVQGGAAKAAKRRTAKGES